MDTPVRDSDKLDFLVEDAKIAREEYQKDKEGAEKDRKVWLPVMFGAVAILGLFCIALACYEVGYSAGYHEALERIALNMQLLPVGGIP